ncbi:MAG: DUF134 domain-containing protein [Candidatus Odinarchaeum yellowstonii]|uniref:DUF134 domain-containing protein n=1 Tax=Odinarchaeota yellowstonii (strain LCB_4) TaxID=1841599 RepID=A0AAF0D1X6_ODILC|nr:MAG: DUF134 domain-containing protein [Candidatus Odinarchaeum yellowstonii]
MGYRWRRCCRGRPPKERQLSPGHCPKKFIYENTPNQEVTLYYDELEAIKLVDLDGLSQEEAGQKMNISRGTIWRLLQQAHRKIAEALTTGKTITIKPNNTNQEQTP